MKKTPKKPRGSAALGWILAHIDYQWDDCLKWPYARDARCGRGMLGYGGRQYCQRTAILALKDRFTQVEIGEMFDVSFQTVGRLHREAAKSVSQK